MRELQSHVDMVWRLEANLEDFEVRGIEISIATICMLCKLEVPEWEGR